MALFLVRGGRGAPRETDSFGPCPGFIKHMFAARRDSAVDGGGGA